MIRTNRIRENILNNIKQNIMLYFLVIVFFAVGVASGAFTLKAIDETQKQALIKYLQNFFQVFSGNSIDSAAVLKQSLGNNIETVIVIWILGITVIGIPVILFVMGVRGFIVGFTVGFLIDGLGWKGFLFTLLAILPQNLIIIPCLIAISVLSISFSTMIIKDRIAKRWTNNYWQKFFSYSINVLLLLGVSAAGSLIEAYLTPLLVRLISSYLAQ